MLAIISKIVCLRNCTLWHKIEPAKPSRISASRTRATLGSIHKQGRKPPLNGGSFAPVSFA